jgi:hypothetical protein
MCAYYLTGWQCRGYFTAVNAPKQCLAAAVGLGLALIFSGLSSFAQSPANRDQLSQQLAELRQTPKQAELLQRPLEAAQAALGRANSARIAGDVEHAIECEALASDYIVLARDILRAINLETQLAKVQTELAETEQKLHQIETLIEVTVAQRERVKAQLMQLLADRNARRPAQDHKVRSAKPLHTLPSKGASK